MENIPNRIVYTDDNGSDGLFIRADSARPIWESQSSYEGKLTQRWLKDHDDKWKPDSSVKFEDVDWDREHAPQYIIPNCQIDKHSINLWGKKIKENSVMKSYSGSWAIYPYVPDGLVQGAQRTGYRYKINESGLFKLSESIRIEKLNLPLKEEAQQLETFKEEKCSDCKGTGKYIGLFSVITCPKCGGKA